MVIYNGKPPLSPDIVLPDRGKKEALNLLSSRGMMKPPLGPSPAPWTATKCSIVIYYFFFFSKKLEPRTRPAPHPDGTLLIVCAWVMPLPSFSGAAGASPGKATRVSSGPSAPAPAGQPRHLAHGHCGQAGGRPLLPVRPEGYSGAGGGRLGQGGHWGMGQVGSWRGSGEAWGGVPISTVSTQMGP